VRVACIGLLALAALGCIDDALAIRPPQTSGHRRGRSRRESSAATLASFTNSLSTDFDGVDEYARAADDAAWDATDKFTYSAWVKLDTAATNKVLGARWRHATQDIWVIQTNGTSGTNYGLRSFIANACADGGTNFCDTAATAVAQGTWTHVALVYDGTLSGNTNRLKIYVNASNAVSTCSGTIPATMQTTCTPRFTVGAMDPDGTLTRYWGPGNIDEVCAWTAALSASEVTDLYNSGKPKICSSTLATNLIVALRMGDGDTHPTLTNSTGNLNFDLVNSEAADFQTDVP